MSSGSAKAMHEKLLAGDRRAAARLISMVECGDPEASDVIKALHGMTGRAHIIGLTGSPGSGKSTLACGLAREFRRIGRSVGIICVDPTSPFTGGALLGDRVRMQDLSSDPEVFIRSMGSRGASGGLSVAINDVITVLDAFGKDEIIIETVGAGQVEIEVVKYAHTCVVVTMPGAGDEIQAIKAGILEIGDLFVVNKSDRDGALRTASDLEMMIETRPKDGAGGWKPPVITTVAVDGRGLDRLIEGIERHRGFLEESGTLEAKTMERMKAELLGLLGIKVARAADEALAEEGSAAGLVARMTAREVDPRTAAEILARELDL